MIRRQSCSDYGGSASTCKARNTALQTLVSETPAPLVAEMLGYSYQISQRHADLSGTNWARYPPTYMSWAEHVKDPDVKGYLTGPGLGLCDRMHHDHHDGDRPPA